LQVRIAKLKSAKKLANQASRQAKRKLKTVQLQPQLTTSTVEDLSEEELDTQVRFTIFYIDSDPVVSVDMAVLIILYCVVHMACVVWLILPNLFYLLRWWAVRHAEANKGLQYNP
jgi:hypothetical protein